MVAVWTVGEDLGSDHLPITTTISCEVAATSASRGHGCSLYVAAPTTFLRRDECDRPDKHRPSDLDLRSGQGEGSPTVFSKNGVASPSVASLLLLLAGDVENNPGTSCYACDQNVRQADTQHWPHGSLHPTGDTHLI